MSENTKEPVRIDTGEKCSKCGASIFALKYGDVMFGGICDCAKSEAEAEAEEKINKRREDFRKTSGMTKRSISQTFNFAPQQYQKKAVEMSLKWKDGFLNNTLGDTFGLLLIGNVGTGKTHLACAILNSVIDGMPIKINTEYEMYNPSKTKSPFVFVTANDMCLNLANVYNDGLDVMDRYKKCKLLIIDDLGSEKQTERSKEQFESIINYRYGEYLPIIITTNLTLQSVKAKYGDRIADRLKEICEIAQLVGESNRKKRPVFDNI